MRVSLQRVRGALIASATRAPLWRAMTVQHETVKSAAGFPVAAEAALRHAGGRSDLDTRGARLIRIFATAVYHLPSTDAVARITLETSPDSVARLNTSVRVTRWLTGIGFPSIEPLPVEQPAATGGCVVTFWRYLPSAGQDPCPLTLGSCSADCTSWDRRRSRCPPSSRWSLTAWRSLQPCQR